MNKPNGLVELLLLAKEDKNKSGYMITTDWIGYTSKYPTPMPEETRQSLFNILLHNYNNGKYDIINDERKQMNDEPQQKNNTKYKKRKKYKNNKL